MRKRLGEVRRDPKKTTRRHNAEAQKGVVRWKKVNVQVQIQRNWNGTYVALACVKGGARRGSKCAGAISAATPTQAFRKALAALAKSR